MVVHLLGGMVRAALVVFVIAAPAFLLPDVAVGTQEIILIVAAIAAAFTIFEYASTHPGLIDFRFAPPYNRMRFVSFVLVVLAVSFVARASAGLDSFSSDVLDLADAAVAIAMFPGSPAEVAVDALAGEAEPEFRLLIARVASVTFLSTFALLTAFGALLWILRWPVARRDFNLWLNLPTFTPGNVRDVERRLFRDARVNIVAGFALIYLAPLLLSWAGFDAGMLRNPQVLVWAAAIWGLASGSMVIRGMAMLKIGWLVRRTRLA